VRGGASGLTIAATVAAMVAFAANSVLCRMALATDSIDPASFTSLRLVSGAAMLWFLTRALARPKVSAGSWESAAYLFIYAIAFSLAYTSLSAGTGALLLFGSVQITMIVWALFAGERPLPGRWLGMATALAGFVYLVLPGITAPSPLGAVLMTTAGVSWGFYSLRRKGHTDPLAATAGNFLRAAPLALLISVQPTVHFLLGDFQTPIPNMTIHAAIAIQTSAVLFYALWASIYRQRFFAHLSSWLSFFPYTLLWIEYSSLTTVQFALPWIGWGAFLLFIGFALDRLPVRYAHGPYLAGYLLTSFALIWSIPDRLTNLYTLGATILILRWIFSLGWYQQLKAQIPVLNKISFSGGVAIGLLVALILLALFKNQIKSFLLRDRDSFYSKAFMAYMDREKIGVENYFTIT